MNTTTINISEDFIKKSMIVFLKSYYRFRPRLGDTVAHTDMLASNGIYADGHLSFPDDKGRAFIATFEATSQDSTFEVNFRTERNMLFWDALAVAALVTAFLFSYLYAYRFSFLKTYSIPHILLAIIFIFLIINILYRKTLYQLPRYRTIFAIERFKQYYADEQWIALGENVFENSEDSALRELKKQCVYNGFGLASINSEGEISLHITPAREVVYGKKRKRIPFISNLLENQVAQRAVTWTQGLTARIPLTETTLLRYHQPYTRQMIMCGLAAALTVTVVFRFNDRTKEKEYVNDIELQKQQDAVHYPETTAVLDSMPIEPFSDKKNTYIATVQEPEQPYTPDELREKGIATEDGVYVSNSGEITFYDCSKLNLEGNNYVICESTQPDLRAAQRHAQYLRQYGIDANYVWKGCFSRADLGYIVFLDLVYESKKNIEPKLDAFRRNLSSKGVSSQLKIISLTNSN